MELIFLLPVLQLHLFKPATCLRVLPSEIVQKVTSIHAFFYVEKANQSQLRCNDGTDKRQIRIKQIDIDSCAERVTKKRNMANKTEVSECAFQCALFMDVSTFAAALQSQIASPSLYLPVLLKRSCLAVKIVSNNLCLPCFVAENGIKLKIPVQKKCPSGVGIFFIHYQLPSYQFSA